MPSRLAIYSAVIGDYDRVADAVQQVGVEVDWHLFTDDELSVRPMGWEITVVTPPHPHPRLAAKWFRMHPWAVLREYDHTIYIDGSIHVRSPHFARQVLDVLLSERAGIALCPHPERSDIWSEAVASLSMEKYQGQRIEEQMAHYRASDFVSTTLWATGVIARDNRSGSIQALGRQWMRENLTWSYQDQLSLPVVLERLGIVPTPLRLDVYGNVYWTWRRDHRLATGKQAR